MSAEAEKMESKQDYIPGPDDVDISPDHDGGVLKRIVSPGEGDGTPSKGVKVSVNYVGKLLDGTIFDSSSNREVFTFTIGKGEVIKAWDIGVATMKKGEKCTLICKPEYAYGKSGSGPSIPPDATLIFDVELLDWKLEDLSTVKDEGILRSLLKDGKGYLTPSEGATVEAHLVGRFEGRTFEERDVKFVIGEAHEANVVEGLDIALQKFKEDEKSKIILAPKYAFGEKGNADFNIPPNSTVEYEVTLNSFEKEKETWNMTSEEKLEQSEMAKNKGTSFFKNERYDMASKQYQKIINLLQQEAELEKEGKEKKDALLLAGYLNLAACYLKLEKYEEVVQNCDKALEINAKSAKGLFRKGQAHLALKDYDVAKELFANVLKVDESNKAAQKHLYICNENLKKQLAKEKKMYQAMFKKMAEETSQDSETNALDNDTHKNGLVENMEMDDEKEADDVEAVPV